MSDPIPNKQAADGKIGIRIILKLLYKQFCIYIGLYTIISLIYRLALNDDQRLIFETLCMEFADYTDRLPVKYALGFYFVLADRRTETMFQYLSSTDCLETLVDLCVDKIDESGQYICQNLKICLESAETEYRYTFTSGDRPVEELLAKNSAYSILMNLFVKSLSKAKEENKITDESIYRMLLEKFQQYEDWNRKLVLYYQIKHDFVVITKIFAPWTVYIYFFTTLLSSQFLDPAKGYKRNEIDLYVPLFTIGQFFVYFAVLKAADQSVDPFKGNNNVLKENNRNGQNLDEENSNEGRWFIDNTDAPGKYHTVTDGSPSDHLETTNEAVDQRPTSTNQLNDSSMLSEKDTSTRRKHKTFETTTFLPASNGLGWWGMPVPTFSGKGLPM